MKSISFFIAACLLLSFRNPKPVMMLPTFNFKVNSTAMIDSVPYFHNKVTSDSLVGILKQSIDQNEDVKVLEISGYADFDEKSPKELSEKRARIIRDKLVKRGVSPARIQVKGYGATSLMVDKKTIDEEKDPKRKEMLKQANTRVSFRVVEVGR
jgi:hypothetical protein